MSVPTRRRRILPVAVLLAAVFGITGGLFLVISSQSATPGTQIGPAALAAARNQMEWMSGPTLQATYTVPLRRLEKTLRSAVPRHVADDVNVAGLRQQYGPERRIGLAVLRGVFDSLPPGEGVIVHGNVVVLVDIKTNHVILVDD